MGWTFCFHVWHRVISSDSTHAVDVARVDGLLDAVLDVLDVLDGVGADALQGVVVGARRERLARVVLDVGVVAVLRKMVQSRTSWVDVWQ